MSLIPHIYVYYIGIVIELCKSTNCDLITGCLLNQQSNLCDGCQFGAVNCVASNCSLSALSPEGSEFNSQKRALLSAPCVIFVTPVYYIVFRNGGSERRLQRYIYGIASVINYKNTFKE